MLAQLLQDLPAFFDKTPQRELALRVRHPNGVVWRVAADTLILSPTELPETTVDLSQFTIDELATHLVALGFEVPYRNPDLLLRRASVLLAGAGNQDHSNGDQLYAFRSLLWAHLKALGAELATAEAARTAMLRQLILPQAREFWADQWGGYFGLARLPGETDADYTQRIIDEVFRARNNPIAMVRNVKRYTGQDIELFEPWTRMWTLSQSALSVEDHLPSGDYWCYHWLQPIARRSGMDWPTLLAVLRADKPAGTLLAAPASILPPIQIDGESADREIVFAGESTRVSRLWLMTNGILDVDLTLSDYAIIRNWRIAINQLFSRHIEAFARPRGWEGEWDDETWQATRPLPFSPIRFRRTFCRGEVVLSDVDHDPTLGAAFGELQCHLPGRRWVETGPALAPSDYGSLSDYPGNGHWEPIDLWTEHGWAGATDASLNQTVSQRPSRVRSHALTVSPHLDGARTDTQGSLLTLAIARGWSGDWDTGQWLDAVLSSPTIARVLPDTARTITGAATSMPATASGAATVVALPAITIVGQATSQPASASGAATVAPAEYVPPIGQVNLNITVDYTPAIGEVNLNLH